MSKDNTKAHEQIEESSVPQEEQLQNQPLTLEDKLTNLRQEWTSEIEVLNQQLNNLPSLDALLNVIYTKRQKAVDVYYGTYNIMSKQNLAYKVKYADWYNKLKLGANGIRYTNESSISDQCNAQLVDEVAVITQLKAFCEFMQETIKTLDGLQYAISSKIKIHEMLNGLKL
jgi:hypothetical protein